MSVQNCIPLFPEDEIPRIINEILDCSINLQKKNKTEREDHLTYRLYGIITRSKGYRSGPLRYLLPVTQYDVFSNSHDLPVGRLDIAYIYGSLRDSYFAVEAKSLHVTYPSGWQSRISDYVSGDQGMMCFVTGKYSATQRSGAMLGYVFDGDITKARDGISKSILNNAKTLKLSDSNGMIKSNIVKRPEQVDETRHRFGHRPFVIYHMLISV